MYREKKSLSTLLETLTSTLTITVCGVGGVCAGGGGGGGCMLLGRGCRSAAL